MSYRFFFYNILTLEVIFSWNFFKGKTEETLEKSGRENAVAVSERTELKWRELGELDSTPTSAKLLIKGEERTLWPCRNVQKWNEETGWTRFYSNIGQTSDKRGRENTFAVSERTILKWRELGELDSTPTLLHQLHAKQIRSFRICHRLLVSVLNHVSGCCLKMLSSLKICTCRFVEYN